MRKNYTPRGIKLSETSLSEKSNRLDKGADFMYIVDGIAYAGEPEPIIKVSGVRPMENHKLWVRFNTGETKIFDFKPLLDMPAFAPLKSTELFNRVYIDYGVPVWNDEDIDIAPEKIYRDGVPCDSQIGV